MKVCCTIYCECCTPIGWLVFSQNEIYYNGVRTGHVSFWILLSRNIENCSPATNLSKNVLDNLSHDEKLDGSIGAYVFFGTSFMPCCSYEIRLLEAIENTNQNSGTVSSVLQI